MSLLTTAKEWLCAFAVIWFLGLCLAVMLGVSDRYVRRTQAWIYWSVAVVSRTAKQWVRAIYRTMWRALVNWVFHHTRHW